MLMSSELYALTRIQNSPLKLTQTRKKRKLHTNFVHFAKAGYG